MSAPEIIGSVRRHPVPGMHNLRDVGGYPAETGTTRWGKLFRSDALHLIAEEGREKLVGLGIGHIVDLRGVTERTREPSAVAGLDLRVHEHPIFDDAAPIAQSVQHVTLATVYDHILDERGAQLAAAIRAILDAGDDEAVLVHCTAGKDRTGLVIALALLGAGVERASVIADYALTEANLAGAWAERMLGKARDAGLTEPSQDVVDLMIASPAPVLTMLLERIDREYGSPTAYLRAIGLADADLARLTGILVG